jgi:hypothetical protein
MASSISNLVEKISPEKITLCSIVTVAFYFRVYELPTSFFIAETHNVFNGLRLHTLDFFNFGGDFSENFFKSFFGSIAGLRHALSTYVSSTIYGWLGIPLNQFWLLFFYVFLGTCSVVGTYLLGAKLSDYRFGLAGAAILAINSDQVLRSRSDNAEAMVTLVVLLCILALFHYKQHPTWIWRTVLGVLLALVASMESIALLPLIVLYQILLFVPAETSYSKKLAGCYRYLLSKENIFIWLPCLFTLLIHFYVYIRIGMNYVGLFGYMVLKSKTNYTSDSLLENFAYNLQIYNHSYFSPEFFYSSLAVLILLVIYQKKIKFSQLFLYSGVGFFYFLILFTITGANNKLHHLYICDTINVLFLGAIWISLFDLIVKKFESTKFAHIMSIALYAGLILFLLTQTVSEYQTVKKRQRLSHPLKAIGYYIHEYGGGSPTVYSFLNCINQVSIIHNSEFYFGTQIIDMKEKFGLPRKLFCMGSKSIEETLSAYQLDDFDFYVTIYGYSALRGTDNRSPHFNLRTPEIDLQIQDLLAKGVKRVAVIKNKESIMGEVYSRKNLPFKEMKIEEYNALWDKEYANISGIIKTQWSGITSTFGYYWDPVTGIP